MDSRRILISLVLVAVMMLPVMAGAYCVTWVLCPYKPEAGDPSTRYLAIDDANLPGPDWVQKYKAVNVRGREDAYGQALVCIETHTFFNKAHVEELSMDVGCEVVPREDVKSKLVAPYVPGFDEVTQKWYFNDGKDGREVVTYPDPDVRHFNDSAVQ